MNILFVCSGNNNKISPFITDQADELVKLGVNIFYFSIQGKGIWGYLKNLKKIKNLIKNEQIDLIHAHYGLSGLLSSLQRKTPVVITFHGSDIHQKKNILFSKLAIFLSTENIFVSQKLKDLSKSKKGYVIPCGVDTSLFYPRNKIDCKKVFNLSENINYVLFSSSFSIKIKNPELAINSISEIENCELIELKNFTREEVAILMNAADVCLMTSFNEGSPQFIKESLASCKAIVSTKIGDVPENFGNLEGCFLIDFSIADCVKKIRQAIEFSNLNTRTNGLDQINKLNLDSKIIATQIKNIYLNILSQ
jgi:teichuronic acid biosynthesis glycosyltransferase TuaC